MKSALVRLLVLGSTIVGLAGISGCASDDKTKKADSVTSNYGPDEYITVPPETGSHIPKKIKVKDALSESGSTKSKVEEVEAEEFKRGMRQMKTKPDGS
jgi:hypothetical protein